MLQNSTGTVPENGVSQNIQQFIHRFKTTHSSQKAASVSDSSNSEEFESLQTLVKTLAERLKTAQETIEILQSQNNPTDFSVVEKQEDLQQKELIQEFQAKIAQLEQEKAHNAHYLEKMQGELEAQLSEREKKLRVELQKHISEKENIQNSLLLRLKEKDKEIEKLKEVPSSQRVVPPISRVQENSSSSREVVAKMALSIKALEEEVHTIRCEKIALQREIQQLIQRLQKEEAQVKKVSGSQKELEGLSEELSMRLKSAESTLDIEKTTRLDLERTLSYKEAQLSEKEQICSTITERLQEVEMLLAEKLEKGVLLEEGLVSLQGERDALIIDKDRLLEEVRIAQEKIGVLESEKNEKQVREQELMSELVSTQDALQQVEKAKYALEVILDSSLSASDLIKKALETMARAHGSYFTQQESNRNATSQVLPEESNPASNVFSENHSFRASSSYNLF